MRIVVDIMSGDNAPLQPLLGVCRAVEKKYAEGVDFTLVGDENVIKKLADENKLDISRFDIRHADDVIVMEDDPMSVMREKKGSSMAVGLRMLAAGEGDAFVSCGNTGALFCGSSLIVKRVKGIQRAAIGALLPLTKPVLLIDSGANVKVNDEYLHQFAIMGSAYMKALYNVESPEVAIINNGSEETKGGELQLAAYERFSKSRFINFKGNVEGNQIPFGACDVAVCDGFVGNIVLKSLEGMGKLMSSELKKLFKKNIFSIIGALFVKKGLDDFKKKFDAKEHGGAPILGISKTVIKAHGSSDAKAFSSAIRQAVNCLKTGVVDIIAEEAAKLAEEKKAAEAAAVVAESAADTEKDEN